MECFTSQMKLSAMLPQWSPLKMTYIYPSFHKSHPMHQFLSSSFFFGHPFISEHFWQFSSLNWQVWMAQGAAWGGQVYRRGLSSKQTLLSSFSFFFQYTNVRKQIRYHSPPTSWRVTAEIKQETKIWQTCEDLILTYGIVPRFFESYNSRPTCSMHSDHLCCS